MNVRETSQTLAENPRIQYDEPGIGGQLDEFVARDVAMVHFEAMSQCDFWIGITLNDGRSFAINCGAVNNRAKGYATCEQVGP